MNLERWHRLLADWGTPEDDEVFRKLVAAYSEPHRHYHTSHHIADCLAQLDAASAIVNERKEVEIALWFHDAIYEPTSSENERRSADWAAAFLSAIGAEPDQRDRVHAYIMATKHTASSHSGDAAVVADVDLSILGRNRSEFALYEEAIRKEYFWVPQPLYRRKRAEILHSFLDRSSVFDTDLFRNRYEQQARENLKWAIQSLRG